MNNFAFPPQKQAKPQVAYSEIKFKVFVTDIILKKDKNGQDYWVIKTELDRQNNRSFLAFSTDYNLSPPTAYLLMNSDQAIKKFAWLTIKKQNQAKKDDLGRIIRIELE